MDKLLQDITGIVMFISKFLKAAWLCISYRAIYFLPIYIQFIYFRSAERTRMAEWVRWWEAAWYMDGFLETALKFCEAEYSAYICWRRVSIFQGKIQLMTSTLLWSVVRYCLL